MIRVVVTGRDVAMVTRFEGATILEPMQFLWPSEARRTAQISQQRRKTVPSISSGAGEGDCPRGRPLTPNDNHSDSPDDAA